MTRRRHSTATQAWPGFILTYQGSDIGVVERVDDPGEDGIATVYVRGGISGALQYAVPASAIAVASEEGRVILDATAVFEPEAAGPDGRVVLAVRVPPHGRTPTRRAHRCIPRNCADFRVYAEDGFFGEVEVALCHSGGEVDFLVVRTRRRFRTRYPVLPAHRVVECKPLDSIIVAAGTRRELTAFSEQLPRAS